MKTWQNSLLVMSLIFGSLVVFFQFTELGVNRTKSLPYQYFLIVKGFSFEKGDLVSIKGHQAKYIGDIPLIKRVVGVAGDQVSPLLISLKRSTKKGEPLTPLAVKVIPEGYVFVNADHKHSYDSRYEEFGLVEVESIKGRAFGFGEIS